MNNQHSSSTVTIDLLRHGQCEDGHCYRGSSDVALTDDGYLAMCKSLGLTKDLSGVSSSAWQRIITSPLQRCVAFANDLAQKYELPIQKESAFQEIHFGQWEGRAMEDVWQSEQTAVENWFADPVRYPPPDGEAADAFADRVITCLYKVLQQRDNDYMLLVTHGGVIRVILAHCLSMSLEHVTRFDVPYACLSKIQVIKVDNDLHFRLLTHNMSSS